MPPPSNVTVPLIVVVSSRSMNVPSLASRMLPPFMVTPDSVLVPLAVAVSMTPLPLDSSVHR